MRTSTFIMTLRWTARITSILMLLMIMAFFVGEGFNPIRLTYDEAIRMIFFGGTILGLIIAFRWEGI